MRMTAALILAGALCPSDADDRQVGAEIAAVPATPLR